ncbi:sn-glycerol-3-phosphate ABC transporter ATP-binding protein UgpC [Terrisporobacter mayombei]|nr:sn-glycerol-3-phosphate ABC transporter ATP-binding protein UgpC [Terrisporobacter mayombei]
MAKILLENVSKIYDDGVNAVKNFNLNIEDKEFVIFVGPSGCGKSTTLRMIAGLESISKGQLLIDGVRMNEVEPSKRDIAMVFQNYALYPHMTVFDNIAYSLKLKKQSKDEIQRRVKEVSDILGLKELLKRKPRQLSGGQRQRVAMGRAIVRNPKVFLMDEPLSNLDAKLRNQMRVEILKLYNELETTFIYVTHDQTEAMTLGTKIVVMKDGIIQQVDSPQNLYNNPVNMFVAGFIGSPQMNFIEVTCVCENNKIYLDAKEDKIELSLEESEKLVSKGYINKKVILGVRPEDVRVSKNSKYSSTIRVCERLGSESNLYFDFNGNEISARISGELIVTQGDNINFEFNTNKIYLFDLETEKVI